MRKTWEGRWSTDEYRDHFVNDKGQREEKAARIIIDTHAHHLNVCMQLSLP